MHAIKEPSEGAEPEGARAHSAPTTRTDNKRREQERSDSESKACGDEGVRRLRLSEKDGGKGYGEHSA